MPYEWFLIRIYLDRNIKIKGLMLTKKEIFQKILDNKDEIKRFGVTEIGLFGSYLRNEQTDESDVDVLINYSGKFSYFDLIRFEEYLQFVLSIEKIDVVTKNGLSKYIGPYILKEVEYVEIGD
jgi:uncharacterized protein